VFSSEVEAGSRQENASNQQSRAPFRFHRNGKGSRRHRTHTFRQKAVSILAARGTFRQFERTQAKFLPSVRRCRRIDECKRRIRELFPDSKIFRGNGEPPEREHVSARFGHPSDFLPCDFVDRQSLPLGERSPPVRPAEIST
jgi:hypothetical protein